MQLKAGANFEHLFENYQDFNGFILEGGSRSGKTWSIIQFLIVYCLQNDKKIITIGRDTLTDLKDTILPDLLQQLESYGIEYTHNKSNKQLYIGTNLIRYIGVSDNPNKTHGLRQDIFWLNEIMPIDEFTFDQLEQRTAEFWIMDYNPSSTVHWAYDVADKRDDVSFFKSTVIGNPFAGDKERNKILSYEPTPENELRGTADKFMWEVYGLGLRADAENKIFKEYQYFDELPKEWDYKFYGLDFGFANDPTAVIEVVLNGNNLYVTEHCYSTGLLNRDIAKICAQFDKNTYIMADSAEPKSIQELRSVYNLNIVPAKKGAGSIAEGIKKIKGYKVFLNKKSLNLHKEFQNYSYIPKRKTEKNGQKIPQDKDNHLIDALRYSISRLR